MVGITQWRHSVSVPAFDSYNKDMWSTFGECLVYQTNLEMSMHGEIYRSRSNLSPNLACLLWSIKSPPRMHVHRNGNAVILPNNSILVTACTTSCNCDSFQCNQWWKFRQNGISISVRYILFVNVDQRQQIVPPMTGIQTYFKLSWWRHHSGAEFWCFLWSAPEQMIEQTIEVPVIWDAIAPIMTSLQCLWNTW